MGTIRKRPNPAVAQSERAAQIAEDLAGMASQEVKSPTQGQATANATRALAQRRRTGANRIRKEKPYLIETEI